MADRVHPTNSPPLPKDPEEAPSEDHSKPRPGTYVIQIPKDAIYKTPPPQNAHLFETYSRRGARGRRGSPCCRCLVWTFCVLLALLLALAVTAAILYFVFSPKIPSYSLQQVAIKGFDPSLATLSPEFNLTVRADNGRNEKVGFYYRDGSDVSVSYSGMAVCSGFWPVFYQPKRNVTVFETTLKGSGIKMSTTMQGQLLKEQNAGQIPLVVDVRVPVKVKFGGVTTWVITVKVKCDVVVDKLTGSSKIVSNSCKSKVDL